MLARRGQCRPGSSAQPAHILTAPVACCLLPASGCLPRRSRSLHATADIFQQLKANQDEPDPVAGTPALHRQPSAAPLAARCPALLLHAALPPPMLQVLLGSLCWG